jgi:hypothetical protein
MPFGKGDAPWVLFILACIAIRSHFVENCKLVEELLKLRWSPRAINFNAQKSVIVSHISPSDRLAAPLMRY